MIDFFCAKAMIFRGVLDVVEGIENILAESKFEYPYLGPINSMRLPRMKPSNIPLFQYDPVYEKVKAKHPLAFFFVHPYLDKAKRPVHRGASYIGSKFGVHTFRHKTDNDYYMTLFGAAHEIGHLLGAKHVRGQSIMNPDPIGTAAKNNWKLLFSPESVEQMKQGWLKYEETH